MTVQVQRFVLRSFLRGDWSPDRLESQLSSGFVARTFLPAVTTAVHPHQRCVTMILDRAHPTKLCKDR